MFTRINPLIRFLNKDEIPRMSVINKILREFSSCYSSIISFLYRPMDETSFLSTLRFTIYYAVRQIPMLRFPEIRVQISAWKKTILTDETDIP